MSADISDPLSQAFSATLTRLRQLMREPLAALPVPLGPPDVGLLQHLADHPGSSPQCLARHQGRDKAQLTRKIKSLEAAGLIEREADRDDGRRVCLSLTRQGEVLAAESRCIREQAFSTLLAALDPAERQQLLRLLEKCLPPTS
ncbi:MAG: MarR family winged helix-turn-helix transcriptional regulator [Pseudomonadota bacterium]|nr:MarR family winged helix-turn-helix transcriptional regulator [Pseudomonadota bacterium]